MAVFPIGRDWWALGSKSPKDILPRGCAAFFQLTSLIIQFRARWVRACFRSWDSAYTRHAESASATAPPVRTRTRARDVRTHERTNARTHIHAHRWQVICAIFSIFFFRTISTKKGKQNNIVWFISRECFPKTFGWRSWFRGRYLTFVICRVFSVLRALPWEWLGENSFLRSASRRVSLFILLLSSSAVSRELVSHATLKNILSHSGTFAWNSSPMPGSWSLSFGLFRGLTWFVQAHSLTFDIQFNASHVQRK